MRSIGEGRWSPRQDLRIAFIASRRAWAASRTAPSNAAQFFSRAGCELLQRRLHAGEMSVEHEAARFAHGAGVAGAATNCPAGGGARASTEPPRAAAASVTMTIFLMAGAFLEGIDARRVGRTWIKHKLQAFNAARGPPRPLTTKRACPKAPGLEDPTMSDGGVIGKLARGLADLAAFPPPGSASRCGGCRRIGARGLRRGRDRHAARRRRFPRRDAIDSRRGARRQAGAGARSRRRLRARQPPRRRRRGGDHRADDQRRGRRAPLRRVRQVSSAAPAPGDRARPWR